MSTDKGVKLDTGKRRWGLFPWGAAEWIVKILEYGAQKYTANGWQSVPNARQRYMDALLRHTLAAAGGEWLDPESGLPHLAHAGCNALFLLHFGPEEQTQEPGRCPKIWNGGWCGRTEGHLGSCMYETIDSPPY
jgi:hypothetical protein